MSDPDSHGLHTLQFYTTAEYTCSYLLGHRARSQVAAPAHLVDNKIYSHLIDQGFRRSGNFVYRPACQACQACLPLRVSVHDFHPSRTQKRIIKRHQSLQVRQLPLSWHSDHYALYRRYLQARHAEAGSDAQTQSQYQQFLLTSNTDSCLVEFRDPDGVLQIVALIDKLEQGWSAVYTFYNPDATGSLGTYCVLWQIDQCASHNLNWLYLGYWIQESRKMAYKVQFQPCQILKNGQWQWI